ncbi:hypothetical protein I552_0918 [Mycobacterium xenopi 3993]|nr:hypothetical protein I552_0918 [Mycobacterium xenopi 3993]
MALMNWSDSAATAFGVLLTIGLAGLVLVVMDFFGGPTREAEQPAQVVAGQGHRNRHWRTEQAGDRPNRN